MYVTRKILIYYEKGVFLHGVYSVSPGTLPAVSLPCCGAKQNIPFIPRAAGVQPLHNLRGNAGPLPALSSRAGHRHVLCHTDCPHRPCRSGSRVAPGILSSELLQSNLFWLELRLSLWAELCVHETHTNFSPIYWSASGTCSRTLKDNANKVLPVQITGDCIIAIFIIAD